MRLDGKTALITGGGRGIGKGIALAFAREGCDVAVTARTAAEVEEVAGEIAAMGRRALALTGDIADPANITRIATATLEEFSGIDVLVNNAAYACFKPTLEYTLDEWERTLSVNLTAPFLFAQAVVPSMIARGSGRIINISSVAGLRPIVKQSAYCASKHGLNGFGKTLAMELRDHGISVHSICPGGVDTRLAHEALPDRDKSNWMTPEDIAQTCLFLVSLSPRATVDEIAVRRFGAVPIGG
jgi:3-oxoacyl-[acyl-carrier protein] reductase